MLVSLCTCLVVAELSVYCNPGRVIAYLDLDYNQKVWVVAGQEGGHEIEAAGPASGMLRILL